MLVVKVELHSAITHKVTEIARAVVYNDGTGDHEIGNYEAVACTGEGEEELEDSMQSILRGKERPTAEGRVEDYPRLNKRVLNLIAKALIAMGYK